ncbi:hypothetical protein [Vreelandella sp. TE19]
MKHQLEHVCAFVKVAELGSPRGATSPPHAGTLSFVTGGHGAKADARQLHHSVEYVVLAMNVYAFG